jgi:hypothetical protein
MFLDIIHRPVYILKHNVSETGFCFRLQVKLTQLGPIDTAAGTQLMLQSTELPSFVSIVKLLQVL